MKPTDFKVDIRSGLSRWRRRLIWQRGFLVATGIAVLILLTRFFAMGYDTFLPSAVALILLGFVQLFLSDSWKRLNPDNFVQHLNRCFAGFEESAQLLLLDEAELTGMQYLQRQRVLKVYRENLARVERWQPRINYRLTALIFFGALLLSVFANDIRLLTTEALDRTLQGPAKYEDKPGESSQMSAVVMVTPPEYTGLEPTRSDRLNLDVMEGSLVQWTLTFDNDGQSYALQLSDDMRLPLEQIDDGVFVASAVIKNTGLYRLVRLTGDEGTHAGGIYSITVTADQAPDIRLITPDVSTLELPRNGPAIFNSEALVNDDFGIVKVEILASVAKGSGEAVKFRDQVLDIGQARQTDMGTSYLRHWDLTELGMEPGDEVYFTVLATDNKQPEANTGRSATLIVRWLDDDQPMLAAEGLAIDFMPEYFKSQRQIIIDTEQLLKDRDSIDVPAFRDRSFSIGRSQADLKEKYGQYLGDEFEEGPGLQLVEHAETVDSHDDHETEDHPTTGFDQGSKGLNNTADILRRFGHNHGDPEIGPIGKRNPVALMKRAVNEMWQAEKHLMQAEPDQALEFEYEAYKYLKLARQADRIYVKRLGFVPPPVSEETRLSGELKDILSYRTDTEKPRLDEDDKLRNQILLADVYQLLSDDSPVIFSDEQDRRKLKSLSGVFARWSKERAGLIRHAATLEKLLLANRLQLDDCKDCVSSLRLTIWGLIDEKVVDFRYRESTWQSSDEMANDYRRFIQKPTQATSSKPGTSGSRE